MAQHGSAWLSMAHHSMEKALAIGLLQHAGLNAYDELLFRRPQSGLLCVGFACSIFEFRMDSGRFEVRASEDACCGTHCGARNVTCNVAISGPGHSDRSTLYLDIDTSSRHAETNFATIYIISANAYL